MELNDVQIQCSTCGREFIFTVKEQEFFNSKGFKAPKHCRECRQKRKQERERLYTSSASGGTGSERPKIKVTCAVCNRETTVPFKPITGKPVLCKDCFIAQKYGTKEGVKAPEKVAPSVPEDEPQVEKPGRPSAAAEAIPETKAPIDLNQVEQSEPSEPVQKEAETEKATAIESVEEPEPEKETAVESAEEPEPEKAVTIDSAEKPEPVDDVQDETGAAEPESEVVAEAESKPKNEASKSEPVDAPEEEPETVEKTETDKSK